MGLARATADDYARQLAELQPRGPAWGACDSLLGAQAEEFARIHNRALDVIAESDPRTTDELFPDWEEAAGLPDLCVGEDQSSAQRRAALIARITQSGDQLPAYYVGIAAELGYIVTITEFHEHTVGDDVDEPIYGAAWPYAWQVNAALNTMFELDVNGVVSDALASWSNTALECVISRLKPAHTHVLFAYT